MYLFVPFKKIFKIVYTRVPCRRLSNSVSLHENFDTTPVRRNIWRRYFIIFLFVPTFYFVYTGSISEISDTATRKFYQLKPSKYDVKVNINTSYSRNIYLDYEPTDKVINGTKIKSRKDKQKPSNKTQKKSRPHLPSCEAPQSRLGITIDGDPNDKNSASNNLFVNVKMGGYFTPSYCKPRHKVGILVPFRDRDKNLGIFLFNIHPFLMKQRLEYRIFVVEQDGADIFNKGRLFNAGFKELMKFHQWQCVIFHDVDLLPLNDGIFYSCPYFPRHMCGTVIQKENTPHYRALFGGVTAFPTAHIEKVNGYSNNYWGWGGEDNDMFWRVHASGLPVVRYNKTLSRYTALPHAIRGPNPHRYRLLATAMDRRKVDGLSNIKYNVTSIKLYHLYTHIMIDINPDKENITSFLENL